MKDALTNNRAGDAATRFLLNGAEYSCRSGPTSSSKKKTIDRQCPLSARKGEWEMRKGLFVLLCCALFLPASVASAKLSERGARSICRSEAHDRYQASNIHSMIVNHRGGDDYIVTGIAEPHRSDKVTFVCTIKNGRLTVMTPAGRPAYRPSGNRPPEVYVGRNGEGEVSFGNGCVVHYNSNGRRAFSSRNCTRAQKNRADDAMAAYRREQGISGSGHGHAASGETPELFVGSNGEGEVVFKSNNCVVYYKSNGRRDHAAPACTRGQRSHADTAMANYRREQGLH